jgi:hypothetical protein
MNKLLIAVALLTLLASSFQAGLAATGKEVPDQAANSSPLLAHDLGGRDRGYMCIRNPTSGPAQLSIREYGSVRNFQLEGYQSTRLPVRDGSGHFCWRYGTLSIAPNECPNQTSISAYLCT